jgi:hypothetical protein
MRRSKPQGRPPPSHWKIAPRHPIEDPMSIFRNISFAGAGADLIAFLRTPRQHRWLLALLACAPPMIIVMLFNLDILETTQPGPPEIIYIESWPASRSLEQIKASNAERQKIEDVQEARAREAYKALGRATGMDVDRIEREANEARARKAKEAAAGAATTSAQTAGAAK